jgi:hypothetical protein
MDPGSLATCSSHHQRFVVVRNHSHDSHPIPMMMMRPDIGDASAALRPGGRPLRCRARAGADLVLPLQLGGGFFRCSHEDDDRQSMERFERRTTERVPEHGRARDQRYNVFTSFRLAEVLQRCVSIGPGGSCLSATMPEPSPSSATVRTRRCRVMGTHPCSVPTENRERCVPQVAAASRRRGDEIDLLR